MKENNCKHFGECGGCVFDKIGDEAYQKAKIDLVKKDLAKTFDQKTIEQSDFIWINKYSRRKAIFHINHQNKLGFFAKKSKNIVEISQCLICEVEIFALKNKIEEFLSSFPQKLFIKATITKFDNGLDLVLSLAKELNFTQNQKLINFAKTQNINLSYQINDGDFLPIFIARANQIYINNHKLDLTSDIFIQATKKGLEVITNKIRQELILRQIKDLKIADIYAGFGAYNFAITDLAQKITAFEGSQEMIKILKQNLAKNNLNNKIQAINRDLFNQPILSKELNNFDFIIINPPRNGATPQIKEIVKSKVKNLIYISCNPKTFTFDSKILLENGFKAQELTILDQFIGSNHSEILVKFFR